MRSKMEENLTPLRWEDVTGIPVIVIDAAGKRFEATLEQDREAPNAYDLWLEAGHTTDDAVGAAESADSYCFVARDFENGRHGDYGLKLYRAADPDEAPEWSDEVFERAEISKGGEVIRPATGTLTKDDTPIVGEPVAFMLVNAGGSEVITREHPGEWSHATVYPLYPSPCPKLAAAVKAFEDLADLYTKETGMKMRGTDWFNDRLAQIKGEAK